MKEENKERFDKLEELAKPLIKYINDYWNPHVKIIVDNISVEVVSGEIYTFTYQFLKD